MANLGTPNRNKTLNRRRQKLRDRLADAWLKGRPADAIRRIEQALRAVWLQIEAGKARVGATEPAGAPPKRASSTKAA